MTSDQNHGQKVALSLGHKKEKQFLSSCVILAILAPNLIDTSHLLTKERARLKPDKYGNKI